MKNDDEKRRETKRREVDEEEVTVIDDDRESDTVIIGHQRQKESVLMLPSTYLDAVPVGPQFKIRRRETFSSTSYEEEKEINYNCVQRRSKRRKNIVSSIHKLSVIYFITILLQTNHLLSKCFISCQVSPPFVEYHQPSPQHHAHHHHNAYSHHHHLDNHQGSFGQPIHQPMTPYHSTSSNSHRAHPSFHLTTSPSLPDHVHDGSPSHPHRNFDNPLAQLQRSSPPQLSSLPSSDQPIIRHPGTCTYQKSQPACTFSLLCYLAGGVPIEGCEADLGMTCCVLYGAAASNPSSSLLRSSDIFGNYDRESGGHVHNPDLRSHHSAVNIPPITHKPQEYTRNNQYYGTSNNHVSSSSIPSPISPVSLFAPSSSLSVSVNTMESPRYSNHNNQAGGNNNNFIPHHSSSGSSYPTVPGQIVTAAGFSPQPNPSSQVSSSSLPVTSRDSPPPASQQHEQQSPPQSQQHLTHPPSNNNYQYHPQHQSHNLNNNPQTGYGSNPSYYDHSQSLVHPPPPPSPSPPSIVQPEQAPLPPVLQVHHYTSGGLSNDPSPPMSNHHHVRPLIQNEDPQPLSVSSHALSVPIEPPLTTHHEHNGPMSNQREPTDYGPVSETAPYIRDGLRNHHGHNTNPMNVDPLLPGSVPSSAIYAPDHNYLSTSSGHSNYDPLSDNAVRRTIPSSYGSLNEITNHERNQYARNFAGEDGKKLQLFSITLNKLFNWIHT